MYTSHIYIYTSKFDIFESLSVHKLYNVPISKSFIDDLNQNIKYTCEEKNKGDKILSFANVWHLKAYQKKSNTS